MTHPCRLILFDLDGTLVDSQATILQAMTAAFAALGLSPPPAGAMRRVIGLNLEFAMARLLPDPGDRASARRLAAAYRQAYWDPRARPDHRERLFPGARETPVPPIAIPEPLGSLFPLPRKEGARRRCGDIVKRPRRSEAAGKATLSGAVQRLPDVVARRLWRAGATARRAPSRKPLNAVVGGWELRWAVLERLDRPPVSLGIATGKNRRALMDSLARHGLVRHFATLQCADEGPGKPHPAMPRRALAEVTVAPSETVLIGDSSFDMEMTRNAGVRGIGVAWGNHEAAQLRAGGADRVIASFSELLPCLVVPGGPQARSGA